MKQAIIQAELDALSKAPDVNACAMADSSSRLVLHPVGHGTSVHTGCLVQRVELRLDDGLPHTAPTFGAAATRLDAQSNFMP